MSWHDRRYSQDDEDDVEYSEFSADTDAEDGDDGGDENDEPAEVPCPYCGDLISEEAERCPACGNYVTGEDAPRQAHARWVVLTAAVLLIAGLLSWFFWAG
jgi:hypothetical protein